MTQADVMCWNTSVVLICSRLLLSSDPTGTFGWQGGPSGRSWRRFRSSAGQMFEAGLVIGRNKVRLRNDAGNALGATASRCILNNTRQTIVTLTDTNSSNWSTNNNNNNNKTKWIELQKKKKKNLKIIGDKFIVRLDQPTAREEVLSASKLSRR